MTAAFIRPTDGGTRGDRWCPFAHVLCYLWCTWSPLAQQSGMGALEPHDVRELHFHRLWSLALENIQTILADSFKFFDLS